MSTFSNYSETSAFIQKFTVFSKNVDTITKKFTRLLKKANKYGKTFSYTIGKEYFLQLTSKNKKETRVIPVIDIEIRYNELIHIDGWTVIAKIEHNSPRNIVTSLIKKDIDPEWCLLPSKCEHCKTKRSRSTTFLVENIQGEIKQVGKSCLKEYTGIDPINVIAFTDMIDFLNEEENKCKDFYSTTHYSEYFQVKDIIACACEVIKKDGVYFKIDEEENSTARKVYEIMSHRKDIISDDSFEKAEEIIKWLQSLVATDIDGYTLFCKNLTVSEYAEARHIRGLAYIPVLYDNYKKSEEISGVESKSEYIGKQGESLTLTVKESKRVSFYETDYGYTHVYKIIDVNDNVFIWYASRINEALGGNKVKTIKGVVKNHKLYNEKEKQTILTRCKVLEEISV